MSRIPEIKTEITAETFNTNKEIQVNIAKAPVRLFAGFSEPKKEVYEYAAIEFTHKHAELYLAQLAVRDGFIEPFDGGVFKFNRKVVLDEISIALGLEANTLRNTCIGNSSHVPISLKTVEDKAKEYQRVASRYGLMKAIAMDESLVALRSINARAYSGRGQNSKRTGVFVHQYDIIEHANGKYLSPYKIEKMVWAVREKAMTKHGQKISFEQALWALGFSKSTSKAATISVAIKRGWLDELGWHEINYKVARDTFIEKLRK